MTPTEEFLEASCTHKGFPHQVSFFFSSSHAVIAPVRIEAEVLALLPVVVVDVIRFRRAFHQTVRYVLHRHLARIRPTSQTRPANNRA